MLQLSVITFFRSLQCINKQLKSKCTNYLPGHPHEERSSPQTCPGWSKTSTEIQNSLLSYSHNTPCLPASPPPPPPPPPHTHTQKKVLHKHSFQFSWDLQSSQENLKTTLAQNFGVVNKVYYG